MNRSPSISVSEMRSAVLELGSTRRHFATRIGRVSKNIWNWVIEQNSRAHLIEQNLKVLKEEANSKHANFRNKFF